MASTGRGRSPEWVLRGVPIGPIRCWTLNGAPTRATFPRIESKWALVGEFPTPYSTTSRKLAIVRVALGGPEG